MNVIIIEGKRYLFNDEVQGVEREENIERLLDGRKEYSFDEVLMSDL
jgi:hypothetical protein